MAAPSLHRSMETFRRSGSSGLVWEDRFISEDLNNRASKSKEGEEEFRELRPSRSVGTAGQLERTHSNGGGGGGGRPYRTGKVSPVVDPPSPKVSACGFCGIFGNSSSGGGGGGAAKKRKPRRR